MRLAPPGWGWIDRWTRRHHWGRLVARGSTPWARWGFGPPDVGVVVVVVVVIDLWRPWRRHFDDVVVDVDGGPAEVDGGL